MSEGYIVVFRTRGPAEEGGGVITASHYTSAEQFEEMFTPDIAEVEEVVVAGASRELADDLIATTPYESHLGMAVKQATGPDGKLNETILNMHLRNMRALYT